MRRIRPSIAETPRLSSLQTQKRGLHLEGQKAIDLLEPALDGIEISSSAPQGDSFYLAITVDRSSRQPCIIASPTTNPSSMHKRMRRFPYPYLTELDQETVKAVISHLQMDAAPPEAHAQVASTISRLSTFYREKEAISIFTTLSISSSGSLTISTPLLHFDDSAFRSNKRQPEIFALRDKASEEPAEVEAEEDGIVFVKLNNDDPSANIGTLVNGAGLAMNTVDCLTQAPHNGKCTNFLDTGGKATSETVKRSFELILKDERVKVIFVNIFGGLTDGGMIADGIILAFKEVDMKGVPVVVRIRGTNEEIGQKKIAESGLELEAFDGFQEAAERVVQIARERS